MADLSAYNDYEREFLSKTQGLPTRISHVQAYESDTDAAIAEIKRLESDMQQAQQLLKSMDMDVRRQPEPTRSELNSRIRTYRATLTSCTTDIKTAKQQLQRANLMGGRSPQADLDLGASASHRERLVATNNRLSKSASLLEESRRTLAETEEVAMDITTELDRNRATLNSARRKVGEIGGITDQARRVLRSMSRREVKIKLFLCFFIVLILGIIGIVVYFLKIKK